VRAVCRSDLSAVRRFGWRDQGDLALRDMDHLVDTPAWGIGLQVPETVGGTSVEAQATVNAAGVVFVSGSLAEDGWRGGHDSL
jgi:hypothetical protein